MGRGSERIDAARKALGTEWFTTKDLAEALRPLVNPMVAARQADRSRRQAANRKGWEYQPNKPVAQRRDDVEVGLRSIAGGHANIWARHGTLERGGTGMFRFTSSG